MLFRSGWEFVGLRNFEILLDSSRMAESLGHTIIFLVGYAGLTLILAFTIALLLNRKTSFSGLSITMLFIPWILADIIAGVIFRLLVLPDYGVLSGILQNPALFPPNGLSILTDNAPRPWFGSFPFPPAPAMIYLILAAAWRALPFITLLLLAPALVMLARIACVIGEMDVGSPLLSTLTLLVAGLDRKSTRLNSSH